MIRNLYIALRFASRPDLHLTVRYYAKMEERGEPECSLVQKVGEFWSKEKPERFVFQFRDRAMFGPRRNIPVLKALGNVRPEWVDRLRDLVPTSDTYPFNAHVTTPEDGPLNLLVTSIAIMHKDKVVWEWEL